MKKYHVAEISVVLALVFAIVCSLAGFASECDDIRNSVIRLHILANSDSTEDQNVKLIVRDTLLKSGLSLFDGKMNVDNAEEVVNINKDIIIKLVNETLKENGFEYEADIYLTEEYFETRVYEDFTMPAGKYKALKIILGEGKGHNWWCVMFPPLCLPAAEDNVSIDTVFTEKGAEIVSDNGKYEVKFKIIELIEELRYRIMAK